MTMYQSLLLHDLVLTGLEDDVRRYVNQNKTIDNQDENGSTPLMLAVQSNNEAIAKILLEQGADTNVRDVNMLTPYLCAGANGFHNLLSLTLKYGADVTSVNRFGGTPLLPSSEKGFLRTVQVALYAGIPVNHTNKLGWSALLEAVILGDGGYLYYDVIEALLEAGADIHLKDRDGVSALEHARTMKQQSVINLMVNREAVQAAYTPSLRLVKQHIRAFEYENALGVLMTNAKGFGDEARHLYYQGYVLMELGRYEEAVAAYREGMSASDSPAQFWLYIANCYRLAKQADKALIAFEQGIAASPYSPFVRYHQSNYLRELGKHEQAVTEMTVLLNTAPWRYDYSFHKANSLRSLGKHEEAVCEIENAITHDYTNALYYLHKAKSLMLLSRNKQALVVINQAIEICDDATDLIELKNELLSK